MLVLINRLQLFSLTLVVVAVLSSCGVTSRYRLDLFVDSGDMQKKVNVEQAKLVKNAVVADPYLDNKLIAGDGNVVMVTVGTRWNQKTLDKFSLLGFDRFWRCRIHLQLPRQIAAGETRLSENSFLQVMEHYQLGPEQTIFLPTDGSFTVDSVTSKALFMTIDGAFENQEKQPLKFTGQFKVDKSE